MPRSKRCNRAEEIRLSITLFPDRRMSLLTVPPFAQRSPQLRFTLRFAKPAIAGSGPPDSSGSPPEQHAGVERIIHELSSRPRRFGDHLAVDSRGGLPDCWMHWRVCMRTPRSAYSDWSCDAGSTYQKPGATCSWMPRE